MEHAHRHMDEVGVAWHLPAEDATVLAPGSVSWRPSWAAAEGEDPVAGVHSALAAHPGSGC
jgi:hypothetical protein